ncbi:MAG: hypothetical protein DI616_19840 [Paracoccus denitrificans]|uniref:Uncharacterized protein n=1 Tax=Paracoccus denitrificans TaxID=266 RepID=A0A533I080_PARDE|nr:MAG: hypothetical protein DI616_19840 [Paracoccus denitrificans]
MSYKSDNGSAGERQKIVIGGNFICADPVPEFGSDVLYGQSAVKTPVFDNGITNLAGLPDVAKVRD